ncbi:MAG: hypothetical protein RI897_4552 [Verrucomicrobiota bacterium]|jgi:cytochrome c553
MNSRNLTLLLATAFCLSTPALAAARIPPGQLAFFENRIRPILTEHCYSCHSTKAERVRGGLLLDSRESILQGGHSGPALMPGKPDDSLLIQAVRRTHPDLAMPPKKPLSQRDVSDLERWVTIGAPDPRDTTEAQQRWQPPKKNWWAWQPLQSSAPPATRGTHIHPLTPIDAFILAKLETANLSPNPPADKRTLIRRATYDLLGLPPTPQEVNDFLHDNQPDAFSKVVDRLLASPHYGERWGRHWLDVARYSDTKGTVRRQREDPRNPHAYTYRDYVIRSFNEDKPFNTFITEQIAADLLPSSPAQPANLAALGFLTTGERFMGMRHDIINDQIDVVTRGFLGLTVACARCHDHKFDPIPTEDYYALHGVFASTSFPDENPIIQPAPGRKEYQDYLAKKEQLSQRQSDLEPALRQARRQGDPDTARRLQRQLRQTITQLTDLEIEHPGAPIRACTVEDFPRARNSPVFIRGEANNRGTIVPRHFLTLLAGPNPKAFTQGSGRLDLAQAITNPSNPLTPRVLVNRVWQHHFGQGLVPTPDDFGTMSEPPSHPELLDYLALQFQSEGWSIKRLHRVILLSHTYQQSSAPNPKAQSVDPENRLLSHANIRRLDFESLRDSILAITDGLDPHLYGPPVDFENNPLSPRRTVYALINRSDLWEPLVNFDFANPDTVNGFRHETTVPQQSLFLMNNPLVMEQAVRLTCITDFQNRTDATHRIQFLYSRIYQREPTPEELQLGQAYIQQAQTLQNNPPPANRRRNHPANTLPPWASYTHALLQANEFSFLQ